MLRSHLHLHLRQSLRFSCRRNTQQLRPLTLCHHHNNQENSQEGKKEKRVAVTGKEYSCFSVSSQDKVTHVQLSRGEKFNTMSREFWNELHDIVTEIDSQAAARVIVISSTGKHFSAGLDLSLFSDESITPQTNDKALAAEYFTQSLPLIQSSFNCLEDARVPVLMACQGGVIGGAMDLICAGDIRWCTEDAFFCIQETNIGMTADVGTFPRLQRLIPEGWVRQMAYTGERISARKAKEIGLVNEVYSTQEELLESVMATAREISRKNPLAVSGCKNMINYGRDHSTADTLKYVGVWNASMLSAAHVNEAATAMKEKREAHFKDLLPVRNTPM